MFSATCTIYHFIMIRYTLILSFGVLGVMVSFPSTMVMAVPAGDIEIWDGQSIEIKQAPYQVALLLNGGFQCGGSIIAKDVVLTAGHCLPSKIITADSGFSIRAGSNLHRQGGVVVKVKEGIQHPKCVIKFTEKDYDYALLRLEKPLAFNENISPVKLAAKDFVVNDGEMMVVSGWGRMRNMSLAEVLQMVELPKFNFDECKKIYADNNYAPVTPRFLCAGTLKGGYNTCQGDSGGPLVYKGVQVGVVSGGNIKCAVPNFPANYGVVSVVRDWIDDFIKN